MKKEAILQSFRGFCVMLIITLLVNCNNENSVSLHRDKKQLIKLLRYHPTTILQLLHKQHSKRRLVPLYKYIRVVLVFVLRGEETIKCIF